jgi:putative PIN family toxin of toxin-antitoxin system
MNLVLDANVFVSAYIWHGIPEVILIRIAKKMDTLFFTDAIINEIEGIIGMPKLKRSKEQIDYILANIKKRGKKIVTSPQHRVTGVCRDPDDEKYLECAIAAGADYIITGDKDLLVLKEYGGVKIVNARSYLDIVGG